MSALHLDIGIDAGGSTTRLRARIAPTGETWEQTGPGSNPQREGFAESAKILATLIRQASAAHPEEPLRAVCAGVAGAGDPADQEALVARVRRLLGPQAPPHLRVVHDAAIAVEGAFEGGSGMIIIAGTGSSLMARTDEGLLLRAGGWGYLFGDEGSGHALGVNGLNAVAAALDGGPSTALQHLLADRYGIATSDALKHQVYGDHWPVQQMAPLVIEAAQAGDAEARRIVAEQTAALARQAGWLARRAHPIVPRVALLGGLSQAPYYHEALAATLRAELPGWHVQQPAHSALVGALRLAMAAGA